MLVENIDTTNYEDFANHKKVVYCKDPESGLKAIIAIHNTNLGPANGGCRMWNYPSIEEAVTDSLRLSKGMTYKSALAGLPLGGGKSVIVGDPSKDKSEELFRAMGQFIESLSGEYLTAEDSGINVHDLEIMATETSFVSGITRKPKADGSLSDGDPSPVTALGVYKGIKAALNHRFGNASLTGVRIAIQGVGHVGGALVKLLVDAGAEVVISDFNEVSVKRLVEELDVSAVAPDKILAQKVDLLTPCALGGAISEKSLEVISAAVIAGAANNQLSHPDVGLMLRKKGILYAPDYVINAGGIIDVYFERVGYDYTKVMKKVERIGSTLSEIFNLSDDRGLPTHQVADELAERIFLNEAASGRVTEVA